MVKPGDGFFSIEQYQRTPKRQSSFAGCGKCKLHKKCYTPKMEPTGKGRLKILIIAEAPGENEDRRGIQLVGKAGKLLRKILRQLGIDLDKDCRKTNALICRPPDNATPSAQQIMWCRPNLLREIKENPPAMIIPLGGKALKSLIGHRFPVKAGKGGDPFSISRWRGFIIPDRELNAWICPTFHPSYINRMEGNKAVEKIFKEDLKTAIWVLKNKTFPKFVAEQDQVEIIPEEKLARAYLRQLLKKKPILSALDYETTGLKPHAKGHEIVSCSISTSPNNAVAFPVTERVKPLLVKYLKNRKIRKIAQNMKFEERWSRVILGTPVSPWLWDTMIAAHCLDNRRQITGLKFQSYIRYGLIDYDSHIAPLLAAKGEDHANAINQIKKIPIEELLLYNGIDTMLTYRLAMDQMKEMGIIDPAYFAKHGRRLKI